MKLVLIETKQMGNTTRELFQLPCFTRLVKDSTPNAVRATPSVRYQLRGRYATNKTIEGLLAQIQAIPEDTPADVAQHLSEHYVAKALIHRAHRNAGTVAKLEAEAATALKLWREALRKHAQQAEKEKNTATMEAMETAVLNQGKAEEWIKILNRYGFTACWERNTSADSGEPCLTVRGDRNTGTHTETATVDIFSNARLFARNGQLVGKVEFLRWLNRGRLLSPDETPQLQLPGMVRVELQPDDAQAAAADLQALVDYACGSSVLAGQQLARAVRGGLELLGKLKDGMK